MMRTTGVRSEPRATFSEGINIFSCGGKAGLVLNFFGRWPTILGLTECGKIASDNHESINKTPECCITQQGNGTSGIRQEPNEEAAPARTPKSATYIKLISKLGLIDDGSTTQEK
jgi:hypothetical protein